MTMKPRDRATRFSLTTNYGHRVYGVGMNRSKNQLKKLLSPVNNAGTAISVIRRHLMKAEQPVIHLSYGL